MNHEQAAARGSLFGDGRCPKGDHPQHQDVVSAVLCNDTYRPGWLIETGWLSRLSASDRKEQQRGTDR